VAINKVGEPLRGWVGYQGDRGFTLLYIPMALVWYIPTGWDSDQFSHKKEKVWQILKDLKFPLK